MSLLYDLGRIFSKAGSISNDIKNIANGRPDRVVKKIAKREIHKELNKNLNNILNGKF